MQLAESGISGTELLEGSLHSLRGSVQQLTAELGDGTGRAGDLLGQAQQVAEALGSLATQLDQDLPAALARVEGQADQTRAAASAIVTYSGSPATSASDAGGSSSAACR